MYSTIVDMIIVKNNLPNHQILKCRFIKAKAIDYRQVEYTCRSVTCTCANVCLHGIFTYQALLM